MFGNLPGSRPGVRSPRRREAGRASATGASAKAGGRAASIRSREAGGAPIAPRPRCDRPPERSAGAEPETPPPAEAEHGGVEDLAWAGIAVAAEAATLGVRLLSRAVEAVRKPADRR